MKIRPLGAEMFYVGGRTDRQTNGKDNNRFFEILCPRLNNRKLILLECTCVRPGMYVCVLECTCVRPGMYVCVLYCSVSFTVVHTAVI
jgi:hypothetical protein